MTSVANSNKLRSKYDQIFAVEYKELNDQQKQAVDQIDGPVMVIAGPGTGKTQILAVRIGKILKQADVQAHNILCLTFTDAATIAMRKRLVKIIGPEAHKVHIYTFHGFCNQIIQENLDIFGNYRQLESVTDLEKLDIYREILDGLDAKHILKRLKGDPNYEIRRLSNLFELMKKENLSPDDLLQKVKEHLAKKTESDEFICKRKTISKSGVTYLKGDFRDDNFQTYSDKYNEVLAASKLFPEYIKIMDREGRYDYQDMILWVLNAFDKHPDLLLKYQERYQFFLVDEFQDTNGAQNRIVEQLISYWEENPNVFVVGDDDQAIYKFQGANLSNIRNFAKNYNPKIVVLEQNYRSNQPILNLSKSLIENNQERIIEDNTLGLSKDLRAAREERVLEKHDPEFIYFENVMQEQAYIVNKIVDMHTRGEDLSKIAIIYRKHKQVEKLVEVLEKKGIPLNVKRKVDILKHPLINNIINILNYILEERKKPNSAQDRLFEIMHYNFFNIDSSDVAKISIHCGDYKEKIYWKDVISNPNLLKELGLRTWQEVNSLNYLLDKWIANISNVTLQQLFENILNEGKVLQTLLNRSEKTWLLQLVSTLFDLIKEETNKDFSMGLKDFLEILQKMKDNNIELGVNKILSNNDGVNFVTAHSAKGLEFDQVYMLGCTKNIWDSSRRSNNTYRFPENINEDSKTNDEDERRLFFVAMTRAERQLTISYAEHRDDGKDLGPSQFVDEILSVHDIKTKKINLLEGVINDFQVHTLLQMNKEAKLIDDELIDRVLEKYVLSVTGLNKYMKCPMTFYFESILKVPTARAKYAGFGRAIHLAFQIFYQEINEQKNPGLDTLISNFKFGMKNHRSHFTGQEFEDMSNYGEQVLEKYFNKFLKGKDFLPEYGLEVKIDKAEYNGVPIKGVLDRVDILKDSVTVTDYKTGKFENPNNKKKLSSPSDRNIDGGDYWRQIVFYKLLLDSDKKFNWEMSAGYVDFVEPKRNTDTFSKQNKYIVSQESIDIVGEQINEAWQGIQNHDFNKLCDEEECNWCNFVRNDYVFDLNDPLDGEDDLQDF